MQKSKLLTICIPTYRRYQDLAICLDKLAFDYKESPFFDILVVDNNSSDETLEVLKARQLDLPSMSAYAWPVNTGAVYNTQQLSYFVETEYMLWLTDDDFLLQGAIKKCLLRLPAFQQKNLNWIFSPIYTYNPDGSHICTVAPRLHHSQAILARSSYYARYAWAFSRQIWKTAYLQDCQEKISSSSFLANSGYWMLYPAVLAISNSTAFFWNESLVYHIFGNKVYWEEFGQEGLKRETRLSLDFNVTYLLGVLNYLKSKPSAGRVLSQLFEFAKFVSAQSFYRSGPFAVINLLSCMSFIVQQSTNKRKLLAAGVLFILPFSYLYLPGAFIQRSLVLVKSRKL